LAPLLRELKIIFKKNNHDMALKYENLLVAVVVVLVVGTVVVVVGIALKK
jgi:hypothetical protein